jgi:hypothetical protein
MKIDPAAPGVVRSEAGQLKTDTKALVFALVLHPSPSELEDGAQRRLAVHHLFAVHLISDYDYHSLESSHLA